MNRFKLVIFLFVAHVLLCVSSCSSKPTYAEIEIESLSRITTGSVAEVVFSMDNLDYWGVVNETGEIFYYLLKDDSSSIKNNNRFTPIGNGAFYYYSNADNNYIIVDSLGQEVANSQSGLFDYILGCGDGLVWVCKNTGDLSHSEYSYGVINSKGEWERPLEINNFSISGTSLVHFMDGEIAKHCGAGIFVADFSWSSNAIIYDSVQNNICLFQCEDIVSTHFVNGYGFGSDTSSRNDTYYSIRTDGQKEIIEPFIFADNGLVLRDKNDKLQILNTINNEVFLCDDISCSQIMDIGLLNNANEIVVLMEGADHRRYFTIIDSHGNQKFPPVQCTFPSIEYFENNNVLSRHNAVIYDVEGQIILEETGYESSKAYIPIKGDSKFFYVISPDGKEEYVNQNGQKISIFCLLNKFHE